MLSASSTPLFGDIYLFRADTEGILESVKELCGVPIDNISASFDTVFVLTSWHYLFSDLSLSSNKKGSLWRPWIHLKQEQKPTSIFEPNQSLLCLHDEEFFFQHTLLTQKLPEAAIVATRTHNAIFALGVSKTIYKSSAVPSSNKQNQSQDSTDNLKRNGDFDTEFAEVKALKDYKVTALCSAQHYTLAATAAGDLYSWGKAFEGQLARKCSVVVTPKYIGLNEKIVEVSCGNSHVLALSFMGCAYSWGSNSLGQLGIAEFIDSCSKPQLINIACNRVRRVAAGWAHSVALTADGYPYSWGFNFGGQLGLGDQNTRRIPQQITKFKYKNQYLNADSATPISQVASGMLFTAFLSLDGRLWLTGRINCRSTANAFSTTHPIILSETNRFSKLVCSNKTILAFAPTRVLEIAPKIAPKEGGTKLSIRLEWDHSPNSKSRFFCDPAQSARRCENLLLAQPSEPLREMEKGEENAYCSQPNAVLRRAAQVRFTSRNGNLATKMTTANVVEENNWAGIHLILPDFSSEKLLSGTILPAEAKGSKNPKSGSAYAGTSLVEVSLDEGRSWTKQGKLATLIVSSFPSSLSHLQPNNVTANGGVEINIYMTDAPSELYGIKACVKFALKKRIKRNEENLLIKNQEQLPMSPKHLLAMDPRTNAKGFSQEIMLNSEEQADFTMFSNGKVEENGFVSTIVPRFDTDFGSEYELMVDVALDGSQFSNCPLPLKVMKLRTTEIAPNIGYLFEDTYVTVKTENFYASGAYFVRLKSNFVSSNPLPATANLENKTLSFVLKSPLARIQAMEQSELRTQEIKQSLTSVGISIEVSFNGIEFSMDEGIFKFYDELQLYSAHAVDSKSWHLRKELPLTETLHPGSTIFVQLLGAIDSEYAAARFCFLEMEDIQDNQEDWNLSKKETIVVPALLRLWTGSTSPSRRSLASEEASSHILKFNVPDPPPSTNAREAKAMLEISIDGQHFTPMHICPIINIHNSNNYA